MKQKIFLIPDLKKLGLTIVGDYQSPESYGVGVGDLFLQAEVISMWDFKNYDKYFTFFDDSYKKVVRVGKRINSKANNYTKLKKDLTFDFKDNINNV